VALKLGTLRLTPSYGLDAVANVSNSTTHTLELSNATTGLVTTSNVVVGKDLAVSGNTTVSSNLTVTGNTTVTGDLNVSGALGILDAIYPVGTVIDRATAITDTHLNGKYKAFLAAPNQEWELLDNGSNAVLEYLTQDGTTTSFCGRASLVPATAVQALAINFQEITGSAIGNFLPLVGTKKIKYSFSFVNRSVLFNLKFQFKVHNDSNYSGAWQEVSDATFDFHQYSTQPENFTGVISCIFTLDDVDNEDEGRIAATRPELSFRVVGRDYDNGTYSSLIHQLNYNFAGDHSASGHATAGGFKPPQLSLVSLGTKSLKYKRTV